MTAALTQIYGPLGLAKPILYANFVSSIDGVVALGDSHSAGSVISGRNPADRFLMGLLRACAGAVVIGAGTLRATPGHLWTAAHVYPDLAADFSQLRVDLGLPPEPRLVVVTAGGHLDVQHPAINHGATIATTTAGESELEGKLPSTCDVIVSRGDAVDLPDLVNRLRADGQLTVLSEGGPHLMGELIRGRLLDEIFLTLSPIVAGRDKTPRLGMVQGAEFLPQEARWDRLMSVRRHGDHLFLRYDLRRD